MAKLPPFKYDEIFTKPVRLLVKESHEIFITIPRNNVDMTRTNVISISRRYRSIVHECVENLTREPSDNADQIKTFKELEVIWNLCEILLLDVNQAGTLIIQLKNWIKMHFDQFSAESKDILRALEANSYQFTENDVAETYWNLVTKLVLRGEHKKAIQLLQTHHAYNTNNQIRLVASMLERMPLSNQYIVHEFYNKWSNWSEECKRERETGQFDNNPALLNIVRLLSQDLDVYELLATNCDTWYQLMVAYLLYTDPCIKQTDLSELCRRSITIFKNNHPKHAHEENPDPDKFDEIIISAFEYDLLQVIANCCSYLDDNWWFVTHFVDLLHCSNQLKIHEIIESDRLRETFLQDYASTLFDDDQLWSIGVAYLDNCPSTGMLHLEYQLSKVRLDIDDEVKTLKIISIAKKRGLTSLAKSTCLLMARGWLSRTHRLQATSSSDKLSNRTNEPKLPSAINLSNALYWAVKSGDTSITTHISDQHLHYYCKTRSFPEENVFGSLRRSPMNNERLAFLVKYYEFKQLSQNEDDLLEAGDLIKALLASKIYPKFFCRELLNDAKSLLEVRPQLVFQPDKTLDLMRYIEEVTKEGRMDDDIDLRKNLVRNMARALITPTCCENL